ASAGLAKDVNILHTHRDSPAPAFRLPNPASIDFMNAQPPGLPADTLVALTGVGVARDGRWLVRNVDLEVRRGGRVTLIGPNGSGKSTVAKAALGVHAPDEGRVLRDASLRVGYVPQRMAIDPTLPLTVDRLLRLTGPLSAEERRAALELVGIPQLAQA